MAAEAGTLLLAGRRALITGGTGRLGSAIAATFAREGAAVVVADVDSGRPAYAQRVAQSGAPVLRGDTSEESDVERIVDEAEARIGPLDVLVTCAAVYPNVPVVEMSAAEWDRVFAVNVRGAMLASRAAARRWIERGTRGALVHLSSGAARSARRGAAAYCASKAALEMLVEVLALELGPYGIRVNAVAPGLVMDAVVSSESPGLDPYYNAQLRATPLGRTGAPADIAEAVAFLASERAAWTTGSTLVVSGGSHCGRAHLDYTRDLAAARDAAGR
jgi:NAD(P)-dependent dehydrogenase (short-subunit alcohol dehydrogenase family)